MKRQLKMHTEKDGRLHALAFMPPAICEEKSRAFLERVMLALDDGVEARQRREWSEIADGLIMEEYAPSGDFAVKTLERAKFSSRRSIRPVFLRIAAAVLAAFLPMYFALYRGVKPGIAAETGAERYGPMLCSIALLAAQSHPHGECSASVPRLRRLLEGMQGKDGSFGEDAASRGYDHAFASYALAENDVLGRGGVSPSLARAISYIESTQEGNGGWDGGNHLVSIWNMGVLSGAKKLGWDDRNGTLRKAMRWLVRSGEGALLDLRRIEDAKSAPSYASIYLTAKAVDSISEAAKSYKGTEELLSLLAGSYSVAIARYEGVSPKETPNFVRSVLQRGQGIASRQTLLAGLFTGE